MSQIHSIINLLNIKDKNISLLQDEVWGYKISNIKLLKIAAFNSLLRLKKQRFLCKNCSNSFSAETTFVNKFCCISNDIKLAITLELQKNISES